MTYLAKPKLHHPDAAAEQARLHAARLRRQDQHAVRRLRPRLDLGRAHPGLLGARRSNRTASPSCPASAARRRRRTTSSATRTASTPCTAACRSVLTGANLANRELLYLGVCGDGDSASHRPRPVRARDAARREHDLHRREQRRLRSDQGPVLRHRRPGQQGQEGRGQHRHARSTWSRSACSSAPPTSARSFSGDKEQLVPLIKGAMTHRGAALHRRDQPVRGLQQPRRQHQELRLRARAQRGGQPPRLHARTATRSPSSYAPGEVIEVTQHDGSVLRLRKLARRLRRRRPARRDEPHREPTRRAARSSPGCCTCSPMPRTCTRTSTRSRRR